MKRYLLAFLLVSCTPHVTFQNRSPVVSSGKFSCYNGNCCWPYLHHDEVKDYHFMVCTHETIRPDGWHSADLSLKTYFLRP